MTGRTPSGKRTRELLRLLPPGFQLVKEGRGAHLKVLRPDGSQLRDERGMPVFVAATTRIPVEYEVARVRRALRDSTP